MTFFFHAFAGCDQISLFFVSCRKKRAWRTWRNFDDVTENFIKPSSTSAIKAVKDAMPMLECFVVLMYGQTMNCLGINSCRCYFFVKMGRAMEAFRPTFAALLQHFFHLPYARLGMENGRRNLLASLD